MSTSCRIGVLESKRNSLNKISTIKKPTAEEIEKLLLDIKELMKRNGSIKERMRFIQSVIPRIDIAPRNEKH